MLVHKRQNLRETIDQNRVMCMKLYNSGQIYNVTFTRENKREAAIMVLPFFIAGTHTDQGK